MSILKICHAISKLKNSYLVKHNEVFIPYSKFTSEIFLLLQKEGYIESYEFYIDQKNINQKFIKIKLKYYKGLSVISEIKMISTPSRHVYSKSKEIYKFEKNMGITVVSTNKGLMTIRDCLVNGLGGKILFSVF